MARAFTLFGEVFTCVTGLRVYRELISLDVMIWNPQLLLLMIIAVMLGMMKIKRALLMSLSVNVH